MNLLFYVVGVLNFTYLFFSSGNFFNLAAFSWVSQVLLVVNVLPLVIALLSKGKTLRFWKTLGLLLLMIVEGVFSFLVVKTGSAYNFVVSIAGFLAVPIYLLVVPETIFKTRTKQWMQMMCMVYTLFFAYSGIVAPIYREGQGALSMGYSNPNRTAIYLMLVVVMIGIAFFKESNFAKRCIALAMQLLLVYLLVLTQCRTATLLSIIFVGYVWLPKMPPIKRSIVNISIVFPLIFIGLYMWLYNMGVLRDVTILDRDVYTGREELFLQQMQDFSLLGNTVVDFEGLNVPLSILQTVGILGAVLFYVYLYRFSASNFLFEHTQTNGKNVPAACLVVILLHGCTERSLFTGGVVYASMVGCILMLIAIHRQESVKHAETLAE